MPTQLRGEDDIRRIGGTDQRMAVRALKHLEEDGLGVEVDVQHKVKSFKDLTSTLYPVFNTMYRSAFRQHNRLLSRAELKVDSIEFNILQVLEDYQIKRRKNEINRQLKTLADTLQAIGRRFEQSNPGPSISRRRTRRMRRGEDQNIGWLGS